MRSGADRLVWRKAAASTAQGADCVEVADLPAGARAVRDSKNPGGAVLRCPAGEWAAFLGGLCAGEL